MIRTYENMITGNNYDFDLKKREIVYIWIGTYLGGTTLTMEDDGFCK